MINHTYYTWHFNTRTLISTYFLQGNQGIQYNSTQGRPENVNRIIIYSIKCKVPLSNKTHKD